MAVAQPRFGKQGPYFCQMPGYSGYCMRVGASHIGIDKPVATVMVTIHGAETRLLKMSI